MLNGFHCPALNAGRSSREKGVRLSVCLSVKHVSDKTGEKSVQIFIPYERSFTKFSEKKNGRWGRPQLPKILSQLAPVGGRVGAKSPIFDQFSLVTSQP